MISFGSTNLFRRTIDRALLWGTRGCAGLAGLVLGLIVLFLVWEAWPLLRQGNWSRFVTDAAWHPADGEYRLWPMLVGTFFVSVGALCVAGPLGILSAVFRRFYAPPFVGNLFQRMIELLAGLPSVVYGLWGLAVLVPWIGRWEPPGASLLAGICVLSLMILPTVTLLVDAGFAALPREYRLGAAALGLSRGRTVWGVVLPATRSTWATALLLALGRALGETMAVLMVCGNVVQVPTSLFDPMRTLTSNIALEMAYALDDHRAALFVSGLLLLLLVMGTVGLAEFLGGRTSDG